MRPYVIASVVAIGLVVAGGVFARAMTSYIASLGIPAGGAIEMPSSTIWLVWLSDVMTDFWWVLIPLVFIACFGAAWLSARAPRRRASESRRV